MPVGLDGNPNPVRSPARDAVLAEIAATITERCSADRRCIGVDGAGGTGKSTFADELTAVLRAGGREVVRSTTDSFHNPRTGRYRRGRTSAEGYYRDSHNLNAIRRELLDPFLAGTPFRTALFDEPSDASIDQEPQTTGPDAVLVFDGLFLHRSELRPYWTNSVYLEAPTRLERARAEAATRIPADQFSGFLNRDVGGWRLYESESRPFEVATWVIDNDDFASPAVTKRTVE